MTGIWNAEAAALLDRAVVRVELRSTAGLNAPQIFARMQKELESIIREDLAKQARQELNAGTIANCAPANKSKRL